MSALLEIKDLWGGYTVGVDILRGINMEVQQGEAVGIIGLNGSGKSTLGKAIMNMIPYRRGQILFNGEDITGLRTDQLAQRGIAIMQQGGRVFPNLSVWDNLQLAARLGNSSHTNFNSQLFEIIPLLQRPQKELQRLMADKLSGGQRHQLSLAMSLANHPVLIIFDEPSAGLSPIAIEEMFEILRGVRTRLNITIMLIEQSIAKALGFCDINVMMQQGLACRIQSNGNIEEIDRIMFKI